MARAEPDAGARGAEPARAGRAGGDRAAALHARRAARPAGGARRVPGRRRRPRARRRARRAAAHRRGPRRACAPPTSASPRRSRPTDVDAALAADDAFHGVFVDVAANAEIAARAGPADAAHPAAGAAALRLARRARVGASSTTQIIAAAAAGDVRQDRSAGSRELALARSPDRPELRMTAIAPPDIHDAETLGDRPRAARRRRRPAADAARGARGGRPQRAVARQRVHQPARARGAGQPDGPAAAVRRGRPARRRGPHRPGQPLVRGHASTSTRSRRCASSCSSGSSRPTTPSTGWSRA